MGLAAYALLTIGFLPYFTNGNFSVYWNLFTKTCRNELDPLLKEYSFIQNAGHEFRGNIIALFYEFNHGRYPYYKDYDINKPIYGGTPQNLSSDNITEHLDVSRENITKYINDTQSSGLGILDFEEWRPLFDINSVRKEVYKEAAIKISGANHPEIINDPVKLNKTAAEEYDIKAREFMERSLKDARNLRNKTRWGYYGFPYCNYDAGKETTDRRCSPKYREFNDRMQYIFNDSQALYPSIYLNNETDPKRNFRYVQAIVAEAQRVAHNYTDMPIYVYTKIEYDPKNNFTSFYTAEDLCSTILLPYIMGVDGLIFWSSSNNMTQRCGPIITNFVNTTLGPFVQNVVKGTYGQKTTWEEYNATREWQYADVCEKHMTEIGNYRAAFIDQTTPPS